MQCSVATTKLFSVPPPVAGRLVSDISLSGPARAALRKLKLNRLGDLERLSASQLVSTSPQWAAILRELNEAIIREQGPTGPRAGGRRKKRIRRKPGTRPGGPDDEISIAPAAGALSIARLGTSRRLLRLLRQHKVATLGDLQGQAMSALRSSRGFGSGCSQELRDIVARANAGQPPLPPKAASARKLFGTWTVPGKAASLKVEDLPLSVRLEGVLKKLGVTTMGELEPLSRGDVIHTPNCGVRTLSEIDELVARAVAGEFEPSTGKDRFGEMIRRIDGAFAEVPAMPRKVMLMRLGTEKAPARTLESVGQEMGVTRERVRQIVDTWAVSVRREGGPVVGNAIKELTQECHSRVMPVTPELLRKRLGAQGRRNRHATRTLIGLLGAIDRSIPVWPDGPTPGRSASPRARRINGALLKLLRERNRPIRLSDAYGAILKQPNFTRMTPLEFLTSLKGAEVKFDFSKPEAATVSV